MKEFSVLCKYLSIDDASHDYELCKVYESKFGQLELKDNKFSYIFIYLTDTFQSIFYKNGVLKKKLIFIIALLEASEYFEQIFPPKNKINLFKKLIFYFLLFFARLQSSIYKLFKS